MTNEKKKELAIQRNKELISTEILDNALANLTKEQSQLLSGKASEEALRLQVKARESMMSSELGRRETLDHIDAWNELKLNGRTTRHKMTTKAKTGSGDRTIESKDGCFVATSAFESQFEPTVLKLREYRDIKLSKTSLGKRFIKWYYKNGPKLAEILNRNAYLKPAVRKILKFIALIVVRKQSD
jgi:hypothetical protein